MLASYADRMCGDAWPSVGRLARECGIGRTATQNALRSIERLGWFERRHAGYGGRASATYILRIGQIARPAQPAADDQSTTNEQPGQKGDRISLLRCEEHRVICTAYAEARFRRYSAGLHVVPARHVLDSLTRFVATLAEDSGQPFERVAGEVMRAYLAQPSRRDGELERQCHPIEWLVWGLGPVERDVRKRLERKIIKRDPAMTVEVTSGVDGGGAARAIAAQLSGGKAA